MSNKGGYPSILPLAPEFGGGSTACARSHAEGQGSGPSDFEPAVVFRWYVIETLGGRYKLAHRTVIETQWQRDNFAREHLVQQGYRVFMPEFQRRPHRKGTELVSVPLFPGYLFVSFNVHVEQWRKISSTRGVRRIICIGDDPAPVKHGQVEKVQGYVEGLARDLKRRGNPNHQIREGQKLRVTGGPFEGLEGLCERSYTERIIVLLDLLGRKAMSVEVPPGHVEPA